jgi:hypothetical protein
MSSIAFRLATAKTASNIASETPCKVGDLLPKPSLRVAAASNRPESSTGVRTDGIATGITGAFRTGEGEGEGEGEGVDTRSGDRGTAAWRVETTSAK